MRSPSLWNPKPGPQVLRAVSKPMHAASLLGPDPALLSAVRFARTTSEKPLLKREQWGREKTVCVPLKYLKCLKMHCEWMGKSSRWLAQHQCPLGAFENLARGTGEEAETLFSSFLGGKRSPTCCFARSRALEHQTGCCCPTAAWGYVQDSNSSFQWQLFLLSPIPEAAAGTASPPPPNLCPPLFLPFLPFLVKEWTNPDQPLTFHPWVANIQFCLCCRGAVSLALGGGGGGGGGCVGVKTISIPSSVFNLFNK